MIRIKLKFHIKTPYDKLAKSFTNCFGHMTKMDDIRIYGKKSYKHLPQNQKADDLGTCYVTFGM